MHICLTPTVLFLPKQPEYAKRDTSLKIQLVLRAHFSYLSGESRPNRISGLHRLSQHGLLHERETKKSAYIPLLLYNYEGELFHLRLGESSLTQLYREFPTEALLTECNSSTCYHLIDNQKGKIIPDSAYRLEVKIRKNETYGRIKLNQSSIPWFEGEMLEVVNNKIRPATSSLAISIRLTQKEDCLLDKTYSTEYQQTTKAQRFEDSPSANAACLDDMTECLSMATKEIVEEISRDIHLILSLQPKSRH